jgi:hypothetical protein
MECERCLTGEEAQYRARSDILDLKVCGACAADGKRLGLAIEVLDRLHTPLPRLTRSQRLPQLVG